MHRSVVRWQQRYIFRPRYGLGTHPKRVDRSCIEWICGHDIHSIELRGRFYDIIVFGVCGNLWGRKFGFTDIGTSSFELGHRKSSHFWSSNFYWTLNRHDHSDYYL